MAKFDFNKHSELAIALGKSSHFAWEELDKITWALHDNEADGALSSLFLLRRSLDKDTMQKYEAYLESNYDSMRLFEAAKLVRQVRNELTAELAQEPQPATPNSPSLTH